MGSGLRGLTPGRSGQRMPLLWAGLAVSWEVAVEPKLKLWVEKDGLLVFSEYRAKLLDHIAKTGSIRGGAERMGLSYRRAWGKIKEIERNLGVRLVESEAGGRADTPDTGRRKAAGPLSGLPGRRGGGRGPRLHSGVRQRRVIFL